MLEHIDAQHGWIPFAMVSGSTCDSVAASLRTLQLQEKFETLVCAGDYERGKPDLEPFLIAAGRLGVKTEALPSTPRSATVPSASNGAQSSSGSGNGQPRLRHQLCLLIRQHTLDEFLLRTYAQPEEPCAQTKHWYAAGLTRSDVTTALRDKELAYGTHGRRFVRSCVDAK